MAKIIPAYIITGCFNWNGAQCPFYSEAHYCCTHEGLNKEFDAPEDGTHPDWCPLEDEESS